MCHRECRRSSPNRRVTHRQDIPPAIFFEISIDAGLASEMYLCCGCEMVTNMCLCVQSERSISIIYDSQNIKSLLAFYDV